MGWNSFRFTSDEALLDLHRRTMLDTGWLQHMVETTKEGSPSNKHYVLQLSKEEHFLEDIENELTRRGL